MLFLLTLGHHAGVTGASGRPGVTVTVTVSGKGKSDYYYTFRCIQG